ncbi:unnamed protein product [Agarophyton chilense]
MGTVQDLVHHSNQTTFEDHQSLQEDLQLLLVYPNPTDPLLHHPHGTLSLPSQILHVRSPYFQALLSPAWLSTCLTKQNASKQVLQDILEFLVTGVITLSSSDNSILHNLSLASLAHEMLLDELENIVVSHIRHKSLNNSNFVAYLRPLTQPTVSHPTPQPPPSIEALLATHLVSNFPNLLRSFSKDECTTACIWRLLSHGLSQSTCKDTKFAARYFTRIGIPSLISILSKEPPHNQQAMRAFLLSFPSTIFARNFEHPKIFSPSDLLIKYRNDALKPSPKPSPPQTRFLCESPHPHPRAARLDATVRYIRLPQNNVYSRLTFDKRSSLGPGAKIAFYIIDPRNDNDPHVLFAGNRLPAVLTLPSSEFWYAFSSPDYLLHAGRDGRGRSRWGWRFFAESTVPEIEGLD